MVVESDRRRQFALQLQQFRYEQQPLLIGATTAIWWLCAVLWLLPYRVMYPELWQPLLVALLTCLTAWMMHARRSIWTSHLLILGWGVTVVLTAKQVGLDIAPYALVPLMAAATFATGGRFMFTSAALACAALLGLAATGPEPVWSVVLPQLVLLWSVALAGWLSSRNLYTALDWAMDNQAQAQSARDEAQAHRAELARLLQTQDILTHHLERANSRLAWAQEAAEKARQLKFQFATNLSHELRTPLNLIVGFSEMMYRSPEVYGDFQWPGLLRGDVYEINRNAQHLLHLINDVLDLSHVEAGYVALHREPVELAPLVEETAAIAAGLLRGRPVKLRVAVAESLPRLLLDRTRIQQVLLNLVSNAARFTSEGSITVGASADEHNVTITVCDTGTGISANDLERIFEEFFSAEGSRESGLRGTGLGLAICRAFVQLHDGRIWAESELGKGSCFYVSLPKPGADDLPLADFQGRHDPGLVPKNYTRQMAVVDDDGTLTALLARYVPLWNPVPVGDMAGALDMAAANQAEAVVVQVEAGSLTDLTKTSLMAVPQRLAGSVSNGQSSVPILFCAMPTRREKAAALHLVDYLNKPITRRELLEAVERVSTPVRRILLVDDDPGFLRLATRVLRSSGRRYILERAYNGEEALAHMREHRPDLVILDLMMPGLDGVQVTSEMRGDPALADVPVLIISARSVLELQQASPIALVVSKPGGLTPTEMVRAIEAVLHSTHGPQQPAAPTYAEFAAAPSG